MRNEELREHTFLQKLNDFSELVMVRHTVFSLPFIFIAMIVASYHQSGTGWFGWRLLFLGSLAAFSARNFAMGVNRYLDRDIDAINPRTKRRPSVDGRIDTKAQLWFIALNAFAFIAVAYAINATAFKLSVPILVILGGYTLFKRFSALAHLVLGVSLGLAPIAGVIAVTGTIVDWSVYLALGVMFWVAGFDLLYSLQDIEFDKMHGLHSIPSRFGERATLRIAAFFHLLAVLLWYAFIKAAHLGIWGHLAVGASAVMLAYEHRIVHKDFTKIDRAFFTVNGYLSFVFLGFIVLEVTL